MSEYIILKQQTVANIADAIRQINPNVNKMLPSDMAQNIRNVGVPIGVVSNIRYSIIDNVLNVKWLDPDDVYVDGSFVIGFGGTRLVMKVGSYPENENDGIVLIDNTTKNKYNLNPFTTQLPIYDDDVVYYFRFFSYTTLGLFNGDTQLIHQNRFNSESYSWDELVENLHSYQVNGDLLPNAGDVIGLEYILSDYCYDANNKKVMLNTRQLVYDNRDRLSSVTIPWVVLGHNANVPQYVQYRRLNGQSYENIFVQSVDDALSTVQIEDKNGNTTEINIEIGDGFQRNIGIGCRTYTETWDLTANIHTYTDTENLIQDISENTFAYSNQGLGRNNAYLVPLKITVNDQEYDFCGYTLTMQPVNCLNTYGTEHFKDIQFDAPEQLTAYIFEKYPDTVTNDTYYWLDDNGYHEINWVSENLFSTTIYQYNNHDIYHKVGQRMVLMTQHFQKDRMYFKLDQDGTTKNPYVLVDEFALSTVYSPTNFLKNYSNNKTFYNNVPNDYVKYNGKIYKCIKETTKTTAINITQNPETLTAYFQEDMSLSIQNNFEHDDLIPSDTIFGYCGTDRSYYGCNLYSESFYRQYCNNTNGSMDANYTAQSKFDSVSKINLANANSLLLKLFKEQDFIKHIKKAANLTVISPINRGYRKYYKVGSSIVECTCDLFWPLGYYEIFGDNTKDGIATFATVYPDNNSRIKYTLTQLGTPSASPSPWWLRTPLTGNTNYEYNVTTTGTSTYNNAYNSRGFSPACLIS